MNHDANNSEDLVQSAESFKQAFEWAMEIMSPEDFESFQEFKNERVEIIPLHLLKTKEKPTPNVTVNREGPNSRIESQVDTRKELDTGKSQDTENTVEFNRMSTKNQVISDLTKDIGSEIISNSLEQEWDQLI